MKRLIFFILVYISGILTPHAESWIRINQLGYIPQTSKVAVMMSQEKISVEEFQLVDAFSQKTVGKFGKKYITHTGPLGQMKSTFRLNFSSIQTPGTYFLQVGQTKSPLFAINGNVYKGTADFVLNYMRQQRCGYNPYYKDSCHQKDGYIAYHPTKSNQFIDVRGGWHDAGDCLQYTTTSANAIYQMMFAYQQNPHAFTDKYQTDGTPGGNGIPDIVDEIRWGLDWLNRMNPEKGELYNQIADDRDHVGMREPQNDVADYGWGPNNGRPVYYCDGKPQQRGTFMNATTGVASTAGKFASDFALGSKILMPFYPDLARTIGAKAADAYAVGIEKPGYCQTVSVRSPYIYEESNWVDDMELGAAEMYFKTGDKRYLNDAIQYGRQEKTTPWMGKDTARHYQWYPFMNMGHYQVALAGDKKIRREFLSHLKAGIDGVWQRAQQSPFRNGIPSIWCSNNLTTAMLTQCILYRQLSGDRSYEEMEGALRDWLLGCNPWGVSMIVEMPLGGNYPRQPHSSNVKLGIGNTTGALVDGPVYTTIFNSLRGVHLDDDAKGLSNNYDLFQPGNMVYHDNLHDYASNEPTMDGTASLTFPLSAYEEEGRLQQRLQPDKNIYHADGIIRGNPDTKKISLVFTAADKADGAEPIISALKRHKIHGSFFFTGQFYEMFPDIIQRLRKEGHYVGSHSYGHLLYFPWDRRDTMLVSHEEFDKDIIKSYQLMEKAGIHKEDAPYFIPPYEHYNSTISAWAKQLGLQVINYTPGTASNGDYTTPSMKNYYSSQTIIDRILNYESTQPNGLNGFFLLMHFGTVPERTDKLYNRLDEIIDTLQERGYQFVNVREMIEDK